MMDFGFTELTKTAYMVAKAYQFELKAIENGDSCRNPFYDAIKALPNGDTAWEVVDQMVEDYYQ